MQVNKNKIFDTSVEETLTNTNPSMCNLEERVASISSTTLLSKAPALSDTYIEEMATMGSRIINSLHNKIELPNEIPAIPDEAQNSKSELVTTEQKLNIWCKEAYGYKQNNRLKAKFLILRFLNNAAQNALSLRHLKLSSLPDIFDDQNFERLHILDVSRNDLTEIPTSIGHCTELKELNLHYNKIKEIPSSIESCSKLQMLDLSNNAIEEIPVSIGRCTELKELNLRYNKIKEIPSSIENCSKLQMLDLSLNSIKEIPVSIGRCTELKELNLGCNKIKEIPSSIENCSKLQMLNLSSNKMREIPTSIQGCSNLQALYICYNEIEEIPTFIKGFSKLKALYIPDNNISSLPNILVELPTSLTIRLESNPLSQNVLDNLQEHVQNPNYQGPRIFYSMEENIQIKEDTQSVAQLVVSMIAIAWGPIPKLDQQLKQNKSLRLWLARLSYIADFKASPAAKVTLLKKVLKYIKLAAENEEFRDLFLSTIASAAETCDDRMALSILHLGIQCALATANKNDPRELSRLLRGVHALSLLEEIARDKVSSLRFVDEIEVYLAYPVKLKEALNLPIEVNDMLYFHFSCISDEELETAKQYVEGIIDNKETHSRFLITQKPWLDYLQKHSNIIHQAEETKTLDFENSENERNLASLEKDYKNTLASITYEIIESIFP